MNFFENQDRARRKTGRLIVMFVIAVLAILAAVNLAAWGILRVAGAYDRAARDAAPVFREDRQYPGRFVEDRMPSPVNAHIGTSIITLLIILGGSAYKTASLSRGGSAVAQLLGGRLVIPQAARHGEAVLQNVVEEMSIASGVPVPQIYVMDHEDGINAFAAGLTTDDAVIGVTRGALEKLNRDELQGVIAHEFSHILNGDMRLNLRLIGILHGILLIALIGYMVLRFLPYSGTRRGRRGNDGGAHAVIVVLLAGAAMIVIGYVGVFFGRLIQAAVSRQREYLADASAVQFTRNAAGLAGALKKIALHSDGSRVRNAHALETAHLFFSSALGGGLTRLLATHPPLIERIKALDPTFNGRIEIGAGATGVLNDSPPRDRGAQLASMLSATAGRVRIDPRRLADRAGALEQRDLEFAAGIMDAIPPTLVSAAHDPLSSRAIALALLLSHDPQVREKQLALITRALDPQAASDAERMREALIPLGDGARLPLLEIARPALRELSDAQAAALRRLVRALIMADGRVNVFEYALHRMLEKYLPAAGHDRPAPIQFYSVGAVRDEAAALLSALAAASTGETDRAFAAGAARLDPEQPPAMTAIDGLGSFDQALRRLEHASPAVKRRIIDAAAHTVAADGQVNITEAELLRTTAAALGVPLPPVFQRQ